MNLATDQANNTLPSTLIVPQMEGVLKEQSSHQNLVGQVQKSHAPQLRPSCDNILSSPLAIQGQLIQTTDAQTGQTYWLIVPNSNHNIRSAGTTTNMTTGSADNGTKEEKVSCVVSFPSSAVKTVGQQNIAFTQRPVQATTNSDKEELPANNLQASNFYSYQQQKQQPSPVKPALFQTGNSDTGTSTVGVLKHHINRHVATSRVRGYHFCNFNRPASFFLKPQPLRTAVFKSATAPHRSL